MYYRVYDDDWWWNTCVGLYIYLKNTLQFNNSNLILLLFGITGPMSFFINNLIDVIFPKKNIYYCGILHESEFLKRYNNILTGNIFYICISLMEKFYLDGCCLNLEFDC